MKIKIVFKYDGSKFNGFQRQKEDRSVQKTIEDALSQLYDEKIEIKGAGRTDTGVHANGQVAHFVVKEKLPDLKTKLNELVRPDIYINNLKVVDDEFHARKSAKKKEYIYKINLGLYKSSYNDYFYQPRYKIHIGDMKIASKYFIGTHDFRNFVSGERDDYTSTIYSITFNRVFDKLEIRFVGTGFYRYMVRNIVGALLEVGKYSVGIPTIREMIDKPEVKKTLPTAPSEGLYLNKVWY